MITIASVMIIIATSLNIIYILSLVIEKCMKGNKND